MWQLVPAGRCVLGWHIDGGVHGARTTAEGMADPERWDVWSPATQAVLEAAGRLDRILILLLWQNDTMGAKTRIVGGRVFVCTCLTCASCCD
ncbi:hypothetical protein QQF64_005062 [Cirrhinus molitorella]|uniref:MHC class I antigen n=1 Tax=Cirrhinus molitorella TaxID=172907 RepID=A0ABR3MI21_9TELE